MIDVSWLLFIAASLILIATPGQDMILVMSRSIAQGPLAGVCTAAGVSVGLVGHTMLATLGLGAILRASEWLFVALKLLGAAYLVYLGCSLLFSKRHELALSGKAQRSPARLFIDGAFSNIANPKIAVFFFAFLPQFVSPAAAHPTLSIFVLGLMFAALTFLVKAPVGLFAGTLSGRLRTHPEALRWIFRASGAHPCRIGNAPRVRAPLAMGHRRAQRGFVRAFFPALVACAAGFVLLTSRGLPQAMASHFDAAGAANASMPREIYVGLMLVFAVALPLILVYLPGLAFRIPNVRIRLPNRDYWLAPERREETLGFLFRHSIRFGSLLVIFICYVHWLVVRANARVPPRLPTSWLLGGLFLFMALAAVWALALVLYFQRIPRRAA